MEKRGDERLKARSERSEVRAKDSGFRVQGSGCDQAPSLCELQ
jgi:hypothetical protein